MKFSIFLDIDGVLFKGRKRCKDSKEYKKFYEGYFELFKDIPNLELRRFLADRKAQTHFFDRNALNNLMSLIKHIEDLNFEVSITLCSAWRKYCDVARLQIIFGILPFAKYIADKTYDKARVKIPFFTEPMHLERVESIELYLKQHPEISQFIILDDSFSEQYRELFPNHYVQCNVGDDTIFGKEEYCYAIWLLNQMTQTQACVTDTDEQWLVKPTVKPTVVHRNEKDDKPLKEVSMRFLNYRLDFLSRLTGRSQADRAQAGANTAPKLSFTPMEQKTG